MPQLNHGNHIENIIGRQECKKHKSPRGVPCFVIRKGKGFGWYAAICNRRAVLAGANGEISPSSYSSQSRVQYAAKKEKARAA